MVFGFGKGKIELYLDKASFSPGETINGKISLRLKKPIKASRLIVVFEGIKTVRVANPSGKKRSRDVNVYKSELKLDGKKEYLSGDYDFKIKVPKSILGPQLGGTIGTAIKAYKMITEASSKVKWYVRSYLDIPMGFDVSKKIQINIIQV